MHRRLCSIPHIRRRPGFAGFVTLAIGLSVLVSRAWAEAPARAVLGESNAWATPWYLRDSGNAGPTVMVVGGMHGNEPAGAEAADQIRHWPITRGRLIVVPRANVLALEAEQRYTPGVDEPFRDLNRNFPRRNRSAAARCEQSQALWRLVVRHQPDWLVDLHEGYDFRQLNDDSVGSSVVVHPSAEAEAAARLLIAAVNADIEDPAKRFVRLGPPVNGSLARGAGEHLGTHAMILETTRKAQPLSHRVRQHRVMVHRLLVHLEMVSDAVTTEQMIGPKCRAEAIRVALYDSQGSSGNGVPRVCEIIRDVEHASVVCVGPEDIRAGALDRFDVVVFTGGSGSAQAAALDDAGREAVHDFVRAGGGYVGICAGAYLACEGFPWAVDVLGAKTVSPRWRRGRAMVRVALTDAGEKIFGDTPGPFDVLYVNGPIIEPSQQESLPAYEPLAIFQTEVAENDSPQGVMIGSPAITAGQCGAGRVICFSPHPEQTEGLEALVRRAIEHVARAPHELGSPPVLDPARSPATARPMPASVN